MNFRTLELKELTTEWWARKFALSLTIIIAKNHIYVHSDQFSDNQGGTILKINSWIIQVKFNRNKNNWLANPVFIL